MTDVIDLFPNGIHQWWNFNPDLQKYVDTRFLSKDFWISVFFVVVFWFFFFGGTGA
jgi:hypothetical protein